jgi:Holliday junction DNA helicase RuvA
VIARLFGKIADKHPNRLVVDVSGVGYDVHVPLSTFYVAADVGADMALRIHTHVREDQLALYGFATELELLMFERLLAVSGIGPKLALAVLSGIEPRDLAGAIQRNDLARLTAIPGVGKKTAERMCLELRDKLEMPEIAAGATPTTPTAHAVDDDVQSALVNLGYRPKDAETAVSKAREELGADAEFSAVLKRALRQLTR